MITSLDNVKLYLGISGTTYDNELTLIKNGVEQAIKNVVGKPVESVTYTNEMYDGDGGNMLFLDHAPVISIARLSVVRENAIKINNTKTDATNVSVVVDATNVTLTVSGGSGAHTDALAIATYSTLTLLVDAINALSAYGWIAELADSDYASILSANLLPQNVAVTNWNGLTGNYDYIQMAGKPISSYRIYKEQGVIEYAGGFPPGRQNIAITYTAGAAIVPADIVLAECLWMKYLWNKRQGDAEGLKGFSIGELTVNYDGTSLDMPLEVRGILENNRMVSI